VNEHEKTRHLPFMQGIADADVAQLQQKDREYGASWKSRGGVGAFMMLARKWDRLENMVRAARLYMGKDSVGHDMTVEASKFDILDHARGSELENGDAEALLDTIGDLRRYLLLVEAEVIAARPGAVPPGYAAAASQSPFVVSSLPLAADRQPAFAQPGIDPVQERARAAGPHSSDGIGG